MSKYIARILTSSPKWLLVVFIVTLVFSLSNISKFKLDASSDSLVLESDDDLKYYREVSADYSASDFLIVIYHPSIDLFSTRTVSEVREMVNAFENIEGVESCLLYTSPSPRD